MRWMILTLALGVAACDDAEPSETQARADAEWPSDAAGGGPDGTTDAAPAPGDAGPSDPPDAEAGEPTGCAVDFVWDPRTATALETFPDDYYTDEDPDTATGLRPYLGPDRALWLGSIPGRYGANYRQIERLDGWGTSAGVILRFSGPVAPPEGAIRFVGARGESADDAYDVPFEIQRVDDGATLILWPMAPLAPATRHAVVVSAAIEAADGGCVSPSAGLAAALAGEAPFERIGARFEQALAWTGVAADEAVAVAAFTTQSIADESVRIAADIAARSFAWSAPASCVETPAYRICDRPFGAADYRGPDGVVAGSEPVSAYELEVRAWLPPGPPEPRPVAIFGHGLGVDREQAVIVAEWLSRAGIITVAIDAPAHGRHPTATPGSTELEQVTTFFGIDLRNQTLDALVLRDHFRQATYDKLQLLRLLREAPDLDGDGEPDVDPARLAYFGGSLGGIMGPELLSLSPDLSAALLTVPGGRVASIISDGPTFSVIVRAMTPVGTRPGDVARLFPLIQTLIERGDAVNYGPHVLRDRLPGAGATPPHLLVNMAIDDSIIPNVSTRALARALAVPHVPPILQDIGGVPIAPPAPLSSNLDDGRTTAGLFQFDRGVRTPEQGVERADHDVAITAEGIAQTNRFFETWAATGVPEIIDPYEVLGTPPLPAP